MGHMAAGLMEGTCQTWMTQLHMEGSWIHLIGESLVIGSILVLFLTGIMVIIISSCCSGYNHPPKIFLCFDFGIFLLNHNNSSCIDIGIHASTETYPFHLDLCFLT